MENHGDWTTIVNMILGVLSTLGIVNLHRKK